MNEDVKEKVAAYRPSLRQQAKTERELVLEMAFDVAFSWWKAHIKDFNEKELESFNACQIILDELCE